MITNVEELNAEVKRRAVNSGLDIQVGSDGILSGQIAIIGEAPGQRELEGGQPFIGQSGGLLWKCLRDHCSLSRYETFVTNVIKKQVVIAQGADEKVKVQQTEFAHWKDLLHFELAQLPNLKYILVLGNYALRAVLGENGISNWRGSVIPHTLPSGQRVTVMCMFNPAMVMRQALFQPIFQIDMQKFYKVLTGKFQNHLINYHINPTFKQAFDWCEKMIRDKKPVSFDIEVMSDETACVGLTNDPHEGMCINFRSSTDNRFTMDEEVRLYKKLQQVLSHPDVRLVAQNGNFDSYWLWYKDRIKVKPIWFDTMLAHHALYPLLPHDLGFLTSQYTNHPYYKDDKKLWKEQVDKETGAINKDIDMFWRYNVKDVCITLACQQRMERELESQGMMEFFRNHVMQLQPELTKMTVLGVKCDIRLKDQIAKTVGMEVQEVRERFWRLAQEVTGESDYNPNPSSSIQLCELLYDKLKLPVKGKRSADAKNRERLLAIPTLDLKVGEMLQTLNKFAEEQKFLGTYAEMVVDEDGRIRCDYKQTGVRSAPGRLSSSSTLWGSGTNLQNQPERAQTMFIADEGYEFSYTDGSQAEARVVARIANVEGLLENFEKAGKDKEFDVHRANAARIFKKPYTEIPKHDRDPETGEITLRFLGKRCVHGLNYRMGAEKLAEVCGISRMQANEAYYSYHRAFPEIKRWWGTTLETIRRYRELRTPLGRRLLLLGVDPYADDEMLDSIIAFVPQSTIGDLVASIIYKCHQDKRWPKTAWVSLNIHDAIIASNKLEDGKLVRSLMKEHAEVTIKTPTGDVMIPFEFKHSVPDEQGVHRWKNLEKVKE